MISPIISGIVRVQRVWWPQRDSNPCLERSVRFANHLDRLPLGIGAVGGQSSGV